MKLSANMMLHEKLDYIAKAETVDEQVARARQVANMDVTFAQFMRMASTEEMQLLGLPEGMPDTYKPETDIPDGVAFTTARQEFRRIKNFTKGGSMLNISATKRESAWLQMMEGLHWKEANVLINIKDQTLFSIYPNMREVLTKLGTKIKLKSEQQVEPKKKTSPKKKKEE